jgi:hypothetical protein
MKPIMSFFLLTLFICAYMSPVQAQTPPKFQAPILISSAGQSADVTMAAMLCKKLGLNAKVAAMAKPADLDGIKTLLLVPGFSSKGLGAAGTSREDEMARTKKLLAAAKEKNVMVLTMHLGGKPRRGQQSDDFNKIAAEAAGYLIVVKQGNEDQFFTKIAADSKIPIEIVAKIADVMQPLGAAFK